MWWYIFSYIFMGVFCSYLVQPMAWRLLFAFCAPFCVVRGVFFAVMVWPLLFGFWVFVGLVYMFNVNNDGGDDG